jgi:hypothetical protein
MLRVEAANGEFDFPSKDALLAVAVTPTALVLLLAEVEVAVIARPIELAVIGNPVVVPVFPLNESIVCSEPALLFDLKTIPPLFTLLSNIRLSDPSISIVDVFAPFAIFKVSDRFNVEAFVTPNVDVPGTMSDGIVSVP